MNERFAAPKMAIVEEAAIAYEPDSEATRESAIAAVRRRQEPALMAIRGVKGVGIGRDAIGNDALIVYLEHASVKGRIPSEIDGYPVEAEIVGEIDAYQEPRG